MRNTDWKPTRKGGQYLALTVDNDEDRAADNGIHLHKHVHYGNEWVLTVRVLDVFALATRQTDIEEAKRVAEEKIRAISLRAKAIHDVIAKANGKRGSRK